MTVAPLPALSSRCFGYDRDDRCVVDCDAARVIDHLSDFEETFYLMQLANVQLAESKAYDRLLDDAVGNAKLQAIDETYRLLRADTNHGTMIVLESTVVAPFVIETVRSFVWH